MQQQCSSSSMSAGGFVAVIKPRRPPSCKSDNNCEHPLAVLVLCVFGTCRAFVVSAEVFHTWCPHVDFSRAPVFVSLIALELMSAQFLPLILMRGDCLVTDVVRTITAITSTQ